MNFQLFSFNKEYVFINIISTDHRLRPGHEVGPQRSSEDIDRHSRVRSPGDCRTRARWLLHGHVGRGRTRLRAVSIPNAGHDNPFEAHEHGIKISRSQYFFKKLTGIRCHFKILNIPI